MKNTKPLILVTNDDGVSAPGIRALIAVMSEIGTVVVVAPDSPQSATGHAITINDTLYINKISKEGDAVAEYSCSGTPVDCVKLAVKPDIVLTKIRTIKLCTLNMVITKVI